MIIGLWWWWWWWRWWRWWWSWFRRWVWSIRRAVEKGPAHVKDTDVLGGKKLEQGWGHVEAVLWTSRTLIDNGGLSALATEEDFDLLITPFVGSVLGLVERNDEVTGSVRLSTGT